MGINPDKDNAAQVSVHDSLGDGYQVEGVDSFGREDYYPESSAEEFYVDYNPGEGKDGSFGGGEWEGSQELGEDLAGENPVEQWQEVQVGFVPSHAE